MLNRTLKDGLADLTELYWAQPQDAVATVLFERQLQWLKQEKVSLIRYQRHEREGTDFVLHQGCNCGSFRYEVLAIDERTVKAMEAAQFKRTIIVGEPICLIEQTETMNGWTVMGHASLTVSRSDSASEHLERLKAFLCSHNATCFVQIIKYQVDSVFRSLSLTACQWDEVEVQLLDGLMSLVKANVIDRFSLLLDVSKLGKDVGHVFEIELPTNLEAYWVDYARRQDELRGRPYSGLTQE